MFHRPGAGAASVVCALPPFEEANRTRAFAVTVLRSLNARGFTVAIPDLPGTGESLIATADARLADWRAAYAGAAASLPGEVHSIAIRAGALIDTDAVIASRWRLSPLSGEALYRELMRMGQAAAREDGTRWPPASNDVMVLAGNRVAPELLDALATSEDMVGGRVRTVRLATEGLPADRKLDGPPLWRRAEPGNDTVLAATVADDIAEWIARCGA